MSTFSFSFNLDVADDEKFGFPSDIHVTNKAIEVTPPSSELVASTCFELPCPHSETTDELSMDFNPHIIGDFVFKEAIRPLLDNKFDGESDLIPGKYEGGFKIWECSYDLAEIVANCTGIIPHNPKKILELGCGHGVPAIISMLVFENLTEIVFSDFNSEVLEYTTWPNIMINCSSSCESVRCIAGDWATLSPLIENFDLILSAETLYTVESCRKVCR